MCRTICDVTSSNVLGRLVQCEQKGLDRGRWVGIYTQSVKTAWLCVGLAVKTPQYRVDHCTNCPGKQSSHLTVFKYDLLVRASKHCLRNLITNVLGLTECNLVCSLEQENP